MAFDLTTIQPSEFIEFRDSWIKEAGLQKVGADRLFENAGLSELVELDREELKEYAKEIGLSVIERKRLINGITKLTGTQSSNTPPTPITPINNTNNKSKKSKKKKKT
eukprot:313156_1